MLHTAIGPVCTQLQDGRTMYVRAGVDDYDLPEFARAALQLGRGIEVSARMHFKLRSGEWKCPQPFVHRVDQGRGKDPSRTMIMKVLRVIGEALAEALDSPDGRTALALAAYDASSRTAAARTALALALRQTADQLDAEAHELINGGRMTRRVVWFNDRGAPVHVTQVERADGTLMDPVLEPPTVYGAREWPWTNIKSNEETD